MYILFTTSQKPMARLIRWATGEDCSHTALLVPMGPAGLFIVHANIKGVIMEPYDFFLKENKVVHMVQVPADYQKLREILRNRWNSPYDIGALLFVGLVLSSRRILGLRKWPKQNLWQSGGMYLCTEFVTEFLDGEIDSLITPYKLFERLNSQV